MRIAASEAPHEITACFHNQIPQSLPVAREMASGLHFLTILWQVQIYRRTGHGEEDTMSEYDSPPKIGGGTTTVWKVIAGVAGVYVLASLFLMFEARGRIGNLEAGQTATAATLEKLTQHLES